MAGGGRGKCAAARRLLRAAGACLLLALWGQGRAWLALPGQGSAAGRREALGAAAVAGLSGLLLPAEPAQASGGSTAGKYSTIPSAKRRFYGRVREGIYKFLRMEQPVLEGRLDDPVIEDFYAKTIVLQKGGEPIKGCMFDKCITKEKRTSRWNDFRVASDLLASAFRYDASDVNDYLPQVRLIRAYHKKLKELQQAIKDGDQEAAKNLYVKAKMDLSRYTPMVELAPLTSEDYTHDWDERPQVWCQGSFCV